MTVTELAFRLECTRSMVYRIEVGESRGEDRIDLMRRVARAMDCELVYAIVPRGGKTLEETAEWLRKFPEWRTEKQKARRKKAEQEQSRKWNEGHWEWVRQKREQKQAARDWSDLVGTLSREFGAEKAKRDAEAAAGRPPEPGWAAVWVWERMQALERKAKKLPETPAKATPAPAPASARTAEEMKKQAVPGDVALRTAIDSLKGGEGTQAQRNG